jgi:hypothetical protein
MGRKRRQGKPEKKTKTTKEQRRAIGMANAAGLYLLIEAGGQGRERWVVYDRRTGLEVLTWWPGSNYYAFGPLNGTLRSFADAIAMIGR